MGIETAIIASAVVGAGSSMMSSRSASKSAKNAQSSADYQAQLQYDMSQQQLDFSKQQYQDWQNIFGDVGETLSSYYKNLDPDMFASLGIQNLEQEYTRSRQLLDSSLASRGIANSGITTDSLTGLETARMMGRAEARTYAPMQVAQQQLGFYQAGQGMQSNASNAISNSYSGVINTLGANANRQQQLANSYTNQASQAYAGIGSSIGSGISSYITYNALNNPANMTPNTGGYVPNASAYGAMPNYWN